MNGGRCTTWMLFINETPTWEQRSSRDLGLAKKVAEYSWIAGDVTRHKWISIAKIANLVDQDRDLANQLADMPFFSEAVTRLDVDTLASVDNLQVNYPKILEELLLQGWYLNGMDDLEAALVMIAGAQGSALLGPDDLRGFLVKHHADSRSVTLPLTGDIELVFIQSVQNKLNEDIVDQVEDAVRLLEEFMSTPFPTSEVVLLMATPGELSRDTDVIGLNRGTHMVIDPSLARQGDNNRVLNHQVAHYYWGTPEAPLWFREGAADFLSSYTSGTNSTMILWSPAPNSWRN